MAYIAPTTANAVAGSAILASDMLVVMNDVIDHELYVSPIRAAWTTDARASTAIFSNVTFGTGSSVVSKYLQVGKLVIFSASVTLGTSGSITGNLTANLPVTALAGNNKAMTGALGMNDYTAAYYVGTVRQETATTALFFPSSGGNPVNATAPFTWGAADNFNFTLTYEAA